MSKKTKHTFKDGKRLLNDSTPFAIKESFNQLRTNLMYIPNDDNGCPVYAITSAGEGVGKSTISSNLAISYAQINKKVLLIDADMRLPMQYNIFDRKKDQLGLSELLSDITSSDADAICNPLPNLYLITSGCLPPNPSELIASHKFYELISKWREKYDIIFIDLPPAGVVSDPIAISSLVSGYLLVAMENKSDAKYVNSVINNIEQVGAKVVGLVLNATNLKGRSSKYNYQYNYYSYYSSANKNKKKD